MLLVLQRAPTVRVSTPGTLLINGIYQTDTLEDRIREVPGYPVASWKILGETAVPAGRYKCVKYQSPTFGPVVLLLGVPGFSYILFHSGNTSIDTKGCVLLGKASPDGQTLVGGSSKPARAAFEAKVFQALDAGEDVWVEIKNPITTRAA